MKYLLLMIALLGFACSNNTDSQDEIFNVDGKALLGYDPVAYFTEGQAREGKEEFVLETGEVRFHFINEHNLRAFRENSEKYLPSYGGWCAYAVAESASKMAPDPTNWQIQDGELQFFVSNWQTRLTGSLKDDWNSDPDGYKNRADVNWQEMN